MLESSNVRIDGRPVAFYCQVRSTEDLPAALQFWMAHMARDLLRLGVYFRAAALMSQIPGAAQYRFILYDDNDPDTPNFDENPRQWLDGADRRTTFGVLAECLRRLEAPEVLSEIRGATDYEHVELSDDWAAYLDRHVEIEHGLLNIVAECLDVLIVQPGMAEIDHEPRSTWWQRWWSQMR